MVINMTTKTTYICDTCGESFDTEAECTAHESAHIAIGELVIVEGKYTAAGGTAPAKLKVQLPDGTFVYYTTTNSAFY